MARAGGSHRRGYVNARPHGYADRCVVAPSPDLKARLDAELTALMAGLDERSPLRALTPRVARIRPPGFEDGLIIPGNYYPLGTSVRRVRAGAAERAPLRGTVRVIVVLVDFSDQQMTRTASEFEDLLFSDGMVPTGSARDYYHEVSNGLIELAGEVVGPYRMPRTLAEYANGESGTGTSAPNARTMARDAAVAADADVDFAPYDNDGNGFVDAFVVVHAGAGAEVTGDTGDIWSHKWVLSGGEYATDTTKIFAYLTIPEDAHVGVCAHELGHLLFGWPDLYDTDNTSEGIGNWCLMAGGSWNGSGSTPAHPSAWCKADQGWVTVVNHTANGALSIPDVKDAHQVHRLWKGGAGGSEYFLVENRQRVRFDAQLPGDGLLIWHIDDALSNNTDEAHYKVALEQADGQLHLEKNGNRGDAGDPYPGSSGNNAFTSATTPNSKSYGNLDTCVAVTSVSASGPVMTAQVQVSCFVKPPKDVKEGLKDVKERFKDVKDRLKDIKEPKEFKEGLKDLKEPKEFKEAGKDFKEPKEFKEGGKDFKEVGEKLADRPGGGGFGPEGAPAVGPGADPVALLEARVAHLEALLGSTEPFIGSGLRPDLTMSPLMDEEDAGAAGGSAVDKRSFDTGPTPR